MSIRDEIRAASASLGLSADQFAEVREPEERVLFDAFLAHFTGGVDARWWWEHFTLPTTSARFDDGSGFRRLLELVPDAQEKVWFVAEDGCLPYFPVYDATPTAAQQVIGECYGFEYYLISKDLRWLICENHHNWIVAIGENVQKRLSKEIAREETRQEKRSYEQETD